jgi:hypothetical protein
LLCGGDLILIEFSRPNSVREALNLRVHRILFDITLALNLIL